MEDTGVSHHKTGTTVTIEGPRFSSLAESRIFSGVYGAEIVNMTTCPESTIAKEMGLHYASIAMVTDYDCWKENEEVNVENVMKQMKENIEKFILKDMIGLKDNFWIFFKKLNAISTLKVLLNLIPRIMDFDWTEEHAKLQAICKGSHML